MEVEEMQILFQVCEQPQGMYKKAGLATSGPQPPESPLFLQGTPLCVQGTPGFRSAIAMRLSLGWDPVRCPTPSFAWCDLFVVLSFKSLILSCRLLLLYLLIRY